MAIMKLALRYLTALTLLLYFAGSASGQFVQSVNYQLKYDTTTCYFDAYLIINSGNTSGQFSRIQGNSQFSVVVPRGTGVAVAQNHNPIQGDPLAGGTTPQPWNITTVVEDPAAPYDYHSIVVNTSPTARYEDLNAGDTVKLFSLEIDTVFNCAQDIRIWNNGSDPDPADLPSAPQFDNGFTVGGLNQLYNANSTQLYPPKPLIVDAVTGCDAGVEIDLTASTSMCQGDLAYAWTGPNGFSSTNEDVSRPGANPANNGFYEVIITDDFGCKDSLELEVFGKPNANGDVTVCAGSTDTIYGTDPTSGTWEKLTVDAFNFVDLSPQAGGLGILTISSFASGDYTFRYVVGDCSDTMTVTVSPAPSIGIAGNVDEICIDGTTQLTATTAGTWAVETGAGIATVTAAGLVTGVSVGNATFTFTDAATGCTSTSSDITVNGPPDVSAPLDELCEDDFLQAQPAVNGTWTAETPAIATITAGGLITGVVAGEAKFIYQDGATGCYSDTLRVEIVAKPVVEFVAGEDSICINSSTQLQPSTGGTWASSDEDVATITNAGVVTAVGPGIATFTFTSTTSLCPSDASGDLTVFDLPTVDNGPEDQLCIGQTSTLSPNTGGTWISNNPSVIAVDPNTGVITAAENGFATFTFTDAVTGCENTTEAVIVDGSPTAFADADDICISLTTDLNPGTAFGTWEALNPTIANITSAGDVAEGISAGVAGFIYSETASGCKSDTVFITVDPGPAISNPPAELCEGGTAQLTPSTGGIWTSSDPNVATINNSGFILAIDPGTVEFFYTEVATGCRSVNSTSLTVNAGPFTQYQNDVDEACVGETAQIFPPFGGTWVSTNTDVATITDAGVITAVSAGTATFFFTNTASGCVSDETPPFTVNPVPATSISQDEACIGNLLQLEPTTGGIWSTSNPAVATVSNTGVVTTVGAGSVTFTYTQTGSNCPSDPQSATVNATPTVDVGSDTDLCEGEQITATTDIAGGAWSSSDEDVITIDNAGVITAVGQGSATVTYISPDLCPSDLSATITVNGGVTPVLGAEELCIGETAQNTPSTGGEWTSSNPAVATINLNTGVVTAVSAGTVQFTFEDTTTGCTSAQTTFMTVNPVPVVSTEGDGDICIGETTNVFPSVGGAWTSSDEDIATVSNTGVVTGIAPGKVVFYFVDNNTLCSSAATDSLEVLDGVPVSGGGLNLCIGDSAPLSPNTGGTWTSSSTAVATVTGAGVVTAVGSGSATFIFTSDDGCQSQPTAPIVVNDGQVIQIVGPDQLCIGDMSQMEPATGGTWVSLNPAVATIDAATGEVTAVADGQATFTWTSDATGCTSEPSDPIDVNPAPFVEIDGLTSICIGANTTLTSGGASGVWTSNNPDIATVDNNGLVTAISAGEVTFSFVEASSGCAGGATTDVLTVSACADPDFNVTYVDIPVPGDVSHNDDVPVGSTYGPVGVLTSSPTGSLQTLTVNPDGTYVFTGNTVGVYVYDVPVCVPPLVSGCATAELTITVVDFLEPDLRPVANLDLGSTPMNTSITLATLANDRCVVTTGCSLDATSVTIIESSRNGTALASATTGDITYTPNANYIGFDTLTYQVCVDGEPANCATADQIILVNPPSAGNATQASDDFAQTQQGEPVSGNVLTNDNDNEGDDQEVTTTGTFTNAAGTLVLASDGSYTFTPVQGFFGPVDFPYSILDDNVNPAVAGATLHILVTKDITLELRVYLSGALINNGGATAPDGRPLMRDDLRVSPFNGNTYIPSSDPYSDKNQFTLPLLVEQSALEANFEHKGTAGLRADLKTIGDPTSVFAVTGPDAIVDWVYIQLRDKTDDANIITTRSALVQRDGDVVDMDGVTGVRVPGLPVDSYYIVVRHRNHLGAMTAVPQTPRQMATLVDFTKAETGMWDYGTTKNSIDYTGLSQSDQLAPGYISLWGGNFDMNDKIKYDNPNDDLNSLFFDVLTYPSNIQGNINFDFGFGYLQGDFDMNSKSKYDNPDDDKNYLFLTVLLYPPNNQLFLSNFDLFFEQVPPSN